MNSLRWKACALCLALGLMVSGRAMAGLSEIRQAGVLRHIGVPYANFITGSGDGLDVELVKMFADTLGVRYAYVESSWETVFGDLTGQSVKTTGNTVKVSGTVPVKGDLIGSGLTVLPWRQKVVDFSAPTFPTQVWVLARADVAMQPIVPSHSIGRDILTVKSLLGGVSILGVANTCLEPSLYDIRKTGARVRMFEQNLNELAPAVINGEADTTLLDVPDALIALNKWPGSIKVIGPVSAPQVMGVAFPKQSPHLRDAFNAFLEEARASGRYEVLVKKYYPAVFDYYPEFFTSSMTKP